ncbi:hypothetical protein [Streptococcus sp. CSL10205-OR2]|uniref:hypothetical protein n=1 Tax=Streptococcus sp. CSL10205-OR2 TaxID=2980558 RepID=UPI0021D87898|nr:hypothetical protein [Streptococcus sp. CSL10205-OR2]MCU9533191.1 hypothetical protein [Streptococcus sp. CSL10205-OR2]
MKKKLLFILIPLVIIGGIFIAFSLNNTKKEEDSLTKKEQDRIALYFVNNYDLANGSDIEEIEVIQFKKNVTAGYWRITLLVNNKFKISFAIYTSDSEIITSNYLPTEFIDKTTIGTLTELPVKLKYIERE